MSGAQSLLDLSGRVALVTGGSRGIGREMSVGLARAGAAVAVNYVRNEAAAEATVAAIAAEGGNAVLFRADVSDAHAVNVMVSEIEARLGSVGILVNNAWPTPWVGGSIEELEWDAYQRYVDQMLRAAYNTVRATVAGMRANAWGRIINIGTTAMYELNDESTPYISAKGALLAFTRGLARDLGPSNICVNMVSPSVIYTGEGDPPPGWGEVHAARSALGRNPTAWESAGPVVFLASPLADAVTGIQLPVACGLVMQAG